MGVDVGSHLIKTIVYETSGNPLAPAVLKKIIVPIPRTFNSLRVVEKLRGHLFAITKEFGRVPERTIIGFGPSIAESSIVFWETPLVLPVYTITRREARSFFDTGVEQERDRARSGVFAYPLEMYCNGYPVDSNFFEQKKQSVMIRETGFSAVISYFFDDAGKALFDMKEMLEGMAVEFVPLGVALAEAIVRTLGANDVFLVDIGGKYTQLLFVAGGVLKQIAAFPVGTDHFTNEIARMLRVSFDEAGDIMRQLIGEGVGHPKEKDLRICMKNKGVAWKEKFIETLNWFSPIGPLPERVVVFGGGAYIPKIDDLLKSSDWIKDFSFAPAPKVEFLEGKRLWSWPMQEGAPTGYEEAGLGALISYAFFHTK